MILNAKDLEGLDKSYRRNLINQLSGVKGANLIGTIDEHGKTNLALFNTVVHLGANPACMGFIMRPLTVKRDTYENIKANKTYTINAVNASLYKQAHHTAAKWETSEFEACDFTPHFSGNHKAPYVKSSPIKIGLQYVEEHEIAFNKTVLVVGKIVELIIDDKLLNEKGYFNFNEAELLSVAGLDNYFNSQQIELLDFPRPEEDVKSLTF